MDARTSFPKKDQNGDICAIIKVMTTETGFYFDGDILGITDIVKKTGEYWLYVPFGAKRLTIKHDKLGILRDYLYPERIDKATVYEMQLTTSRIKTIIEEEEITTVWLTINSNPDGADVYINDVLKGTTPYFEKVIPGKYTYRSEKPMYHNESGAIEITGTEPDGKKEMNITLAPAYGFIKVVTTPESGATVFIDDIEQTAKTPFLSDKIKSGTHKITVKKEMFQPKSLEITIADGQTTLENITLSQNFANLTISTQPEADIFIDGTKKGTGIYKGRLLAGVHTFEGKKDKYYSDKKNRETQIGEEVIINLALIPMQGNLDVVSSPIDAIVSLDGIVKGKTPLTLNKLLIGEYALKLEKSGYGTIIKTIQINEGKTTEVNENLPAGLQVTVSSDPAGLMLYLDGKTFGRTPYSGTLSFGKHTLKVEKGLDKVEREIEIIQGGETEFNLIVSVNYVETVGNSSFDMIHVVGGTFVMGCTSEQSDCEGDEIPNHSVNLDNYYIGKTEVTQKLWREIMGSNPSKFNDCENCPVEQVSWIDIQDFLKKLNERTGKSYSLPTEAQWEYAARGGIKSGKSTGEDVDFKFAGGNNIQEIAWLNENSGNKTHPVGLKKPNALGIFDMAGNVMEWCSDWYHFEYYKTGTPNNPQGASSGSFRIRRGGGWCFGASQNRVSKRGYYDPFFRNTFLGFRLVCEP